MRPCFWHCDKNVGDFHKPWTPKFQRCHQNSSPSLRLTWKCHQHNAKVACSQIPSWSFWPFRGRVIHWNLFISLCGHLWVTNGSTDSFRLRPRISKLTGPTRWTPRSDTHFRTSLNVGYFRYWHFETFCDFVEFMAMMVCQHSKFLNMNKCVLLLKPYVYFSQESVSFQEGLRGLCQGSG